MAEQTLAAPAPAPALVFAARAPTELLKQLYGDNEDFLEVPFLPPSLAGAFAGGHKDIDCIPRRGGPSRREAVTVINLRLFFL